MAPRGLDWGFAALIMWLLGFVASGIGGHELLTSLRCGTAPSRIECGELARSGPPDNDFITLTNFTPKLDSYIAFQEEGHWTAADVPLVAEGQATPEVIVHVQMPQSDGHLRDLLSGPEITGIITSRGLFREDSNTLAGYNPGMEPNACWVITLNERPHDRGLLSLIFVGGLALFGASIWVFVEKHRPYKLGESVLPVMSPLIMTVDGLHRLANWLPLPSRRVCGAVLVTVSVTAVAYGGYLFLSLTSPRTQMHIGTELLCLAALELGVAIATVGLSFLLIERRPADA
jgi:hypothetical protein